MAKKMEETKEIVIFDADGQLKLPVKIEKESVWLSQTQICELFDRDKSVISRHIKNVFKEGELERKVVVAKFATTTLHGAMEGKTQTKEVEHYNLDVIISVGYRVKSQRGVRFRQWANRVLKDYLLKGYALNEKMFHSNRDKWGLLQRELKTLQASIGQEGSGLSNDSIQRLLVDYAESLVLLNQFDEGRLPSINQTAEGIYTIDLQEAKESIKDLKTELMQKGEASELFGQEKQEGGLSAVLGAIYQSVFGEDAYPGTLEKAANLLYLIIKNHPFNDGNKRIGAYLMVWFLEKNGIKPPEADMLVTLALLVAISNSDEKDRMVHLIQILLSNQR